MPTFQKKSEVSDPLVKSRRYEVLKPKIDWKLCPKAGVTHSLGRSKATRNSPSYGLTLLLGRAESGGVVKSFASSSARV
jgi:hypothetical protein